MYHLSNDPRIPKKLYPRVPKNNLTEKGLEDGTIPRISFSKSISGALKGISQNVIHNIYFVCEITNKDSFSFLDSHEIIDKVPDAYLSEEIWVTEPVDINIVQIIEVIDGDFLGIYKCPNGLEFENWEWKWVNLELDNLERFFYD